MIGGIPAGTTGSATEAIACRIDYAFLPAPAGIVSALERRPPGLFEKPRYRTRHVAGSGQVLKLLEAPARGHWPGEREPRMGTTDIADEDHRHRPPQPLRCFFASASTMRLIFHCCAIDSPVLVSQ